MKKLIAVISPLVLTACAMGSYPQNPDEYIDAFVNSNNMFVNSLKKTDTFNVSRSRDRVLQNSANLARTCIDGKVVSSRLQEGNLSSRSDVEYSARVETTPAGREVFSVKVKDLNNGTPGMPDDGMYMLAAKFTAVSSGQTAITFYYPPGPGYQNIVDAIKSWSAQGTASCPDLR